MHFIVLTLHKQFCYIILVYFHYAKLLMYNKRTSTICYWFILISREVYLKPGCHFTEGQELLCQYKNIQDHVAPDSIEKQHPYPMLTVKTIQLSIAQMLFSHNRYIQHIFFFYPALKFFMKKQPENGKFSSIFFFNQKLPHKLSGHCLLLLQQNSMLTDQYFKTSWSYQEQ